MQFQTNRSEVTRLLCASALLMGSEFREIVTARLKKKYQGVAPEVGLDARLLLQVVAFIEDSIKKRRRIDYTFMPLFIVAGIIAVVLGAAARQPWVTVIALVLLTFPLQWIKDSRKKPLTEKELVQHFTRSRYAPERILERFQADIDYELQRGLPLDNQNVVVYSGYSPFVGAGFNLGGWSFAINVTVPKDDGLDGAGSAEPIPFQAPELHEQIEIAIQNLHFDNLNLRDMLFVNGQEIRDEHALLPDIYARPAQCLDAEQLKQYINRFDPKIRHYKWIRVHYAGDLLVLSFFLRCSLQANNLFVEISRFLLTPPLDAYSSVDQLKSDEGGISAFLARVVATMIAGVLSVVDAFLVPFTLIGRWLADWGERRRERREDKELREEIAENLLYNYGAEASIRERCSSGNYTRYFQRLDQEMYVKIIERTILDTIVDFLDAHNINTSDLKERRTTILNSGVIIQGGNLEAQNLAVGSNAQATQTVSGAQQPQQTQGAA